MDEYQLLVKNCIAKAKYLYNCSDSYAYYTLWMILPGIAITDWEAKIHRKVAIQSMKEYLGAWVRPKTYKQRLLDACKNTTHPQ